MAEIEIGMGKSGRRAYGLDEVSLVPARRTRDLEDVDTSWEIDAFRFDVPIMASGMDSVVSPATAIRLGELGSVGALNLEGLWTRHDDPDPLLELLAEMSPEQAGPRLREAYAAPVRAELIRDRVKEVRAAGVVSCAAVTPNRLEALADAVLGAELDLLVVQGTAVSAEHVTKGRDEPLDMKTYIRRLDVPVIVGGCSSYQAALHLMRTGAAGVLVGVGAGASSSSRRILGMGVAQATAIADARAARMRHLDETGVYVHLISDGGITSGGDIAKALACGADAVMIGAPFAAATDAPGRGWHWGLAAAHPDLPRGGRVRVVPTGDLSRVLHGPATDDTGGTNLVGALRRTMALTGFASVKELQKAELVVQPGGLPSEIA